MKDRNTTTTNANASDFFLGVKGARFFYLCEMERLLSHEAFTARNQKALHPENAEDLSSII